jgi:hypothetical protein
MIIWLNRVGRLRVESRLTIIENNQRHARLLARLLPDGT